MAQSLAELCTQSQSNTVESLIHLTPSATTQPSRTTDAGVHVWRRVWRHAATPAKDDALIERERRSPRFTAILDRIDAIFGGPRGLRTIELGSGRGDLSVLLARMGARVTLLDFTDAALDSARERFDRLGLAADYVQADMLGDRSAWDGQFDISLSSGVIEHFAGPDRIATVKAHFHALRPGGMAMISVPNAWCVSYRAWKAWLELRGWWPYGMEIPYTRRELQRLTQQAGFESVTTSTFGFWQSLGDHWGRSIFKCNVDWAEKNSFLDRVQGMTLLAFARRYS